MLWGRGGRGRVPAAPPGDSPASPSGSNPRSPDSTLFFGPQLNIAYPPNGTQKKLEIDDDGKL